MVAAALAAAVAAAVVQMVVQAGIEAVVEAVIEAVAVAPEVAAAVLGNSCQAECLLQIPHGRQPAERPSESRWFRLVETLSSNS